MEQLAFVRMTQISEPRTHFCNIHFMHKMSGLPCGHFFFKCQKSKNTIDYNRRELLKHDSGSNREGEREI